MVNHACNLRCSYCYTGRKFDSPMSLQIGTAAIRRAFRSLIPGGCLDVGFSGGEPLLESPRILEWMTQARAWAVASELAVRFNVTTNGTITSRDAWQIMLDGDLDLAVSFDGTPEVHDRHRCDAQGRRSASVVRGTIRQLIESGKAFRVVTVVRPDNLEALQEGLIDLYESGAQQIDLSLDLWSRWNAEDGRRLERFVRRTAELWRQWLPGFGLNWFDGWAGELAGLTVAESITRCGVDAGEIAVAPSGRLYPCERLIGEDRPDHPLRLPGHALEGADFVRLAQVSFARGAACSDCVLAGGCPALCQCGDPTCLDEIGRPDELLGLLNKAIARVASSLLEPVPAGASKRDSNPCSCYVR
jgi:uncharacterized protein